MALITAIELDGDTCALARTAIRGREVTVSAAELLRLTSFPGLEGQVAALRNSRRTLRLPRRCRVVLWGLPDGASPRDPAAAEALAPLVAAGFKVERVVTPCNALGALSRVKSARGDDAICWVAINTAGVAIAAIRPGEQFYARSFGWDSSVGSTGSQARLLQRYSLVAFLAPEVRRAIASAREIGYPVRAVVTCGNLPDLRSLTMPLIEELDTEVETLDSLDGLLVPPAALERLSEVAAAIRVACAGVLARRTRPWDAAKRAAAHRAAAWMRAAAVIALLAGLVGAYMFYGWWRAPRAASRSSLGNTVARVTPPPPHTNPVAPAAPTTGRASPPTPTDTVSVAPAAAQPKPAPAAPPPAQPKPAPAAPPPAQRKPAPAAPAPAREPPSTEPRRPQPTPLTDRLPRVTAILIANDRQFATIDDGRVVAVGDRIGRRVVVRIDERAVTLREPSGARVRVGLDRRLASAR